MKSDKLLKQFQQKGLKSNSSTASALKILKKKKNLQRIDSGQLLSIRGGSNGLPVIYNSIKGN